jgi:hypothetical protein
MGLRSYIDRIKHDRQSGYQAIPLIKTPYVRLHFCTTWFFGYQWVRGSVMLFVIPFVAVEFRRRYPGC